MISLDFFDICYSFRNPKYPHLAIVVFALICFNHSGMTIDGEYVGKTEILRASDSESEPCNLPEFPKPIGGVTGALVNDKG